MPKVCIVTCPLAEYEKRNVQVENAIRLFSPLAEQLWLISSGYPEPPERGCRVRVINIRHSSQKRGMLFRATGLISWELGVAFHLVKIAREVDAVVFYLGGMALVPPALAARLCGKRIILRVTGSSSNSAREIYASSLYGYGGHLFAAVLNLMERINYRLADHIIIESGSQMEYFKLNRYRRKIRQLNVVLDVDHFKPLKPFGERGNRIGFIGRWGEEKGILNFIQAIPLILSRRSDVEFFLGGDGDLRDRVRSELEAAGLSHRVIRSGWIPHHQMVSRLNDLKILVMPSYTEGSPAILPEAMACGTVVIAAPVGGIPDMIEDQKNGFILKNNSPQCIADKVLEVLGCRQLNEISSAARDSVEEGYSFQAAAEAYRALLCGREKHNG